MAARPPQGLPQPGQSSAQPGRPGHAAHSALQEIEEAYNKRLDADITQLLDSFGDIVRVASIAHPDNPSQTKDKYRIVQESYQVQGRATNIVRSAESLVAMLAELKRMMLLNDTTTLAQIASDRHNQLTSKKTAVKQRVLALKEEVDRTVWELERAYYGEVSSSTSATTAAVGAMAPPAIGSSA
ncbi:Mediator of RNA polymerase II transcription subunit 22 [Actinomortierella ambigua]|nr:Mediator of RNA polymerase II transcription subunit 22 [Actinomortierella ambigua]